MTKISCNCFKWDRERVVGRDSGDNLTNVQCKAIGNWHNEIPLYNEYMLIKRKKTKTVFLIRKGKSNLPCKSLPLHLFYFTWKI
jgi:hypothetical protein